MCCCCPSTHTARLTRDYCRPHHCTNGLTAPFRNSATSDGRGVFISQGMVEFVVGYHKGYGKSAAPKIIHRFVPEEVGQPYVYLVWLGLPFVEIMQSVRDGQRQFSPYLWEPHPQEGDNDPDEWTDDMVFDDHDEAGEQFGDEFGAEDDQKKGQEGNKREDVRALNVDGFWNSSKVRTALQRATTRGMGCSVGTSVWRHVVKAIIREYSRDRRVLEVIQDEHGVGFEGMDVDDIRDRQFGHSTHIAGMIYGRDIMENPHFRVEQREQFRRVSVEWHRFLQFASTRKMDQGTLGIMGVKVEGVSPDVRSAQQRRQQSLANSRLEQGLAALLGRSDVSFRGRQAEVLRAIVNGESPVVAVMGTSVGKSVCFMLPAVMDPVGMTVVVVVPLVSLQDNMLERCQQAGIRCAVWQPQHPPDHAQVVLVTPESTNSESFHQFINRQRALGVLDRFVVDECHVALESVDGWRPKVLALQQLVQHQTQLVYLTATLEPSEEARFYRIMAIRPESMTMIRDRTTRGNIAYSVLRYARGQEEKTISSLVAQKKAQYPLPGQIIVYCGTVAQTEAYAELLQCSAYHRNVGDARYKRQILGQFVHGHEQVFTATNALGLGNDRASVRVVIHVGVPRKMRSYAQESGRAGRDGFAGEAIILQAQYRRQDGRVGTVMATDAEEAIKSFVSGTVCRRVVLDLHMDGFQERIKCGAEEARCDVCQQRVRQARSMQAAESKSMASRQSKAMSSDEEGEDEDEDEEEGEAESETNSNGSEEETRSEEQAGQVDLGAKRIRQDAEMEVVSQVTVSQESRPHTANTPQRRKHARVGTMDMGHRAIAFPDIGAAHEHGRQEVPSPIKSTERQADVSSFMQMARAAEDQIEIDALQDMVMAWQSRCAVCAVRGEEEIEHEMRECQDQETVRGIEQACHEVQRRIKYEAYSGCWECGLPQLFCGQWQRQNRGGWQRQNRGGWQRQNRGGFYRTRDRRCGHASHFHVRLVVAMMELGESERVERIPAWSEQQDDETSASVANVGQRDEMALRWMGRKIRWHGLETCQLVRLFYRCGLLVEAIRSGTPQGGQV